MICTPKPPGSASRAPWPIAALLIGALGIVAEARADAPDAPPSSDPRAREAVAPAENAALLRESARLAAAFGPSLATSMGMKLAASGGPPPALHVPVVSVPEPASLILMLTGAFGLAARRYLRHNPIH